MVIIETVKKNNFDNIYEILYIKDDDDFENFLSDSYQRLDLGKTEELIYFIYSDDKYLEYRPVITQIYFDIVLLKKYFYIKRWNEKSLQSRLLVFKELQSPNKAPTLRGGVVHLMMKKKNNNKN